MMPKTYLKIALYCFAATLYFSCKKTPAVNVPPKDTVVVKKPDTTANSISVTSIYPVTAGNGEYITIKGKNLLINGQTAIVSVNDKELAVDKVSTDSIRVLILKLLGSGKVIVKLGGKTITGPDFTYKYKATVTTIAGTGAVGSQSGLATIATFNCPWGIAADDNGDLYIADSYNRLVRKISAVDHSVSNITIPTIVYQPNFASPYNITIDPKTHTLYSTDFNQHVIKINPDNSKPLIYNGYMTTTGIVKGADGYIYVSNNIRGTIMRMNATGGDTTIITTGLSLPRNLFLNKDNVLMVSTSKGIYKIDSSGAKTLVVYDKDFNGWEVVQDAYGNFYEADHFNNTIRIIEKNGNIAILAGNGIQSDVDGVGPDASFDGPMGIAIDAAGVIYVTTYNFDKSTGNKVRKIVVE